MSVGAAGILGNLIVYLIREFNVKSIDGAQVGNVANGSSSLFPIVAAIMADSFFGSFTVALLSSFVSFLVIKTLYQYQYMQPFCFLLPSAAAAAVLFSHVFFQNPW